jgi:hypothetical protein
MKRGEATIIAVVCFAICVWSLLGGLFFVAALSMAIGVVYAIGAADPALFRPDGGPFFLRLLRDALLALFHIAVAVALLALASGPWLTSPMDSSPLLVWTGRVFYSSFAIGAVALAAFFVFRLVRTAARGNR